MKTPAALILLSACVLAAAPKEPPVSLHVDGADKRMLKPSSAFELRFAEPIVAADDVGRVDAAEPLAIRPAIAGKWRWLSTQSGVFQPTEPPALGTTFQVTLAGGLRTTAGKAFRGSVRESFSTPAFGVKGWSSPDYFDGQDAPAQPRVSLLFNADVDAAALGAHVKFVDSEKRTVDALLRHPDSRKDAGALVQPYRSDDRSALTWEQQFREHLAGGPAKKPGAEEEEDEDAPAAAAKPGAILRNQIIISPAKPLPPGKGWQVVVAKGAPSADGRYKLPAPYVTPIGDVKPFALDKIAVENLAVSGKRLTLLFSKRLGKEVKKDPAKFVTVEPAPPNLKVLMSDDVFGDSQSILVRGDFLLGTDYTVTVSGELPAREPFTLGQPVVRKVSFAPVASRLYFQGFSAHQQRAGTRQFGLMAVNVSKLRVAAKLVPAENALAAFEAYGKYMRDDGGQDDEFYQKVDEKTVPGTVVWQQDFTPGGAVDERRLISLNWDDILGAGKTGAVFLTAEQPDRAAPNVKRVGTQALVQVTDLGVAWKDGADSFFHVFSLATAEPVRGASVRILGENGALLADATTGTDGTVRVPKAQTAAKWLLVSHGDDRHMVRFDWERGDLEFGRFRINVFGDEEDIRADEFAGGKRRGLLFTDRPVYRPGELVHLKGMVRSYTPGEPHLASGLKATLRVKGPRGRALVERKLTLSDTGSFDADIQLPKDAVGGFFAQLFFKDNEDEDWSDISRGWSVQEYSPNAFEVKLTPPRTPPLGAPIELPVAAKYYMGTPLSKAQLSWSVRATDERFEPAGFEDFVFSEALFDWRLVQKFSGEPRFSAQGRADLGADGTAKASFTVPQNSRMPQPRRVRFLSEVTDINQQTVAEQTEFLAHSSDFYLGIRRMPDVIREGEVLPVQLVAVRTDGTPMPDPIEATVKLTRVEWQTNRVEDADEAENFRSEPITQLIGQSPVMTAKVVQKAGRWLLADPERKDTTLKLEKPGLYIVTAVARDAAGRDVITTTSVHAYGRDQLAWNYRNRFQVELAADKPEYRAGELATILVKTPINGPALVTVERENVRRYFFTRLEGNAPVVHVPIEDGDAPNVFVSVLVLRGSQDSPKKFKMPEYRIGYTQVRIARPDTKLYVNVKPSRAQYQPGEQAEVVCEVRDVDGKPVANAEVTLWAADEGVLSLTGFETPDPLEFFSKLLRLDVSTGLTIEKLLREGDDALAQGLFENKGYLVGGFGKGVESGVRRRFLGTAYWAASLRSDTEGKVRANFKVPDGLTRYRLMAVAQTKRDQFGHAEGGFEINKPLMLEPAVPRFANVGDQIVLRAVVHNTTEEEGVASVKLQLDATATAAELVRSTSIPAKGSVAVDFPVEFRETGEAKWMWSADFVSGGGKFHDAVETTLKVTFPTPLLREVLQHRVDAAEADLLKGVDPALMQGGGIVRVSISNSRVLELRESVAELLHYPYGCIEQTTSSMLPWLGLRDFREMLPELNRSDAEFQAAIDKGVARIFSMQTANGGLAYWPGGHQAELWSSAYGGLGLVMAKRAGCEVDADDLKRLLDYLSKALRGAADSSDKWELSPRALACYTLALAGRPEAAYHETLFKKRDVLTQESRALLALAVLESKGSAKMADTLLKMQDKAVEEDFWFGSVARAQGVRLLAWSRLAPKSGATEAIANAVFEARNGGHWMTTQGNAWAMLGVAEYIRRTETDRRDVKGALVTGAGPADFHLAAKGAFFEKEFPFDAAATLKVRTRGKGRLFTHVKVEARPKTLVAERKDRGYSITRSYQRINDDGSLAPLAEARVGDRVLVTLEFVAPARAGYVAIDDPLPAVFEAVNPEFKTQAMAGREFSNVWASDFTELRDDRALFFANTMWPGRHQIRYLARVRATGSATAPPAKIEEMYHPEKFGLSASLVVKGTALK
jgi:uncharacterized protein YfaS (alpha-2-macroglobulin family)